MVQLSGHSGPIGQALQREAAIIFLFRWTILDSYIGHHLERWDRLSLLPHSACESCSRYLTKYIV
jgi:hypothetical protein